MGFMPKTSFIQLSGLATQLSQMATKIRLVVGLMASSQKKIFLTLITFVSHPLSLQILHNLDLFLLCSGSVIIGFVVAFMETIKEP